MQLRLVEERLATTRLLRDREPLADHVEPLRDPPALAAGIGEQGEVVGTVHLRAGVATGGEAITEERDPAFDLATDSQGPTRNTDAVAAR